MAKVLAEDYEHNSLRYTQEFEGRNSLASSPSMFIPA